MLKFFNRLEKTRNFVLLVFAILMVGSLVFFYTPARNTFTTNLSTSDEAAAKVGGEKVTAGEIVRKKDEYSQYGMGRSFPAKMVLDGLIGSRIARIEADRLGLTASDAEVADALRQQLKKPDGTSVDQETYKQNAIDRAGSVAERLEAVLLLQRLRNLEPAQSFDLPLRRAGPDRVGAPADVIDAEAADENPHQRRADIRLGHERPLSVPARPRRVVAHASAFNRRRLSEAGPLRSRCNGGKTSD